MCGIFGAAFTAGAPGGTGSARDVLRRLFMLSESRGREASGLMVSARDRIRVLRSGVPASTMVRSAAYRSFLDGAGLDPSGGPVAVVGHSRLVTTGTHLDNRNNQPVAAPGVVGVHNGIVVNHDRLWAENPGLVRTRDVDTEIIMALLRQGLDGGAGLEPAVNRTFARLDGTASIAVFMSDVPALLLATNNGSLYLAEEVDRRALIFASERFILEKVCAASPFGVPAAAWRITPVAAGEARAANLDTLAVTRWRLDDPAPTPSVVVRGGPRRVIEEAPGISAPPPRRAVHRHVGLLGVDDPEAVRERDEVAATYPHDRAWAESLRRCSRCLLPETMPYITFDHEGVCSYCHRYQPRVHLGLEALRGVVDPAIARKPANAPDCVMGVSGGRDSLYALHLACAELKLKPVAYTYDWGMVTDLARRNISRICARLGVEHIVVSADITRKRENIRRNVEAWLRRPRLGVIPLFMAGDKQYFYYLQQVRKQTGAPLAVMGENLLERTDFKTGYAGVRPHPDPRHVYTLPWSSKLGLVGYYAREYLLNPAYLNRSLFDTAFASVCYYGIERDYVNLFRYLPWEENAVVGTLREQYDFELATDTSSTWRIGDGTAAFYNYIYYQVAGFTENDTFRSNQIREGLIDRATALEKVHEENRPRWETIQWYLRTIGVTRPMREVVSIIHRMPRR
ncbi:MAG TPA: hypothetical protein PKC67_15530 [Kiritimatiellia bacterium]|nr:hypothetical protein [Kiritimatiellia bacterium]HMP35746.1 hypothetical protein [Kiritimatiellia bacterium]